MNNSFISTKNSFVFVFLLIVLHFGAIFFTINNMSISYKEALVFFDTQNTLLHFLTNIWTNIFGQNNLSIKLSFTLLHFINLMLLIKISLFYLKQKKDILLLVFIYTFMLGAFSSAILVNEAVINQFGILLFVYFFHANKFVSFALLPILLFLDNSFAILFLSLFFYSFLVKNKILGVSSFLLFIVSMNLFGFDIHHKPQSHFLPTISTYAVIFSPIIFIFLTSILFKHLSENANMSKNILWYCSMTSLIFSLLLSFRQSIDIDDFAPYIVLSFVLIVKEFLYSLRVKLKYFRAKNYIFLFLTSFYFIITFIFTILHWQFYPFAKNIQDDVFSRNYLAKDLAKKLKMMGVNGVSTDKKMQLRLSFYDIKKDNAYLLTSDDISPDTKHIQINYGAFKKDFYLKRAKK